MTALSIYGTNATSSTLATAGLLASVTGASGNHLSTTLVNTGVAGQGYGEIVSQGTGAAWPAAGALGVPSGKGWLFDVTDLENQQMQSGTWAATVQTDVSLGTATADMYLRAWKLANDLTTYTAIGNMTLTAQSLTVTLTQYVLTGTLPAMSFGVGDKLYLDVWDNVTANSTGSAAATVKFSNSNSLTLGRANNMQVVTPGYVAIVSATVLVTTAGHNLLRDGLSGANTPKITYVALGTSTTAPSVNDVKLGAEVFRKKITSYTPGANVGEILINGYLGPSDAININIQELGFFGGGSASGTANSGVLLARGLYVHNPKTGTESIQATLDFTV